MIGIREIGIVDAQMIEIVATVVVVVFQNKVQDGEENHMVCRSREFGLTESVVWVVGRIVG